MLVGAQARFANDRFSFVRSLEERVEQLEAQQQTASGNVVCENDCAGAIGCTPGHASLAEQSQASSTNAAYVELHGNHSSPLTPAFASPPYNVPRSAVHPQPRPQETLAGNLKTISLAAMSEPYLGSMTGLSFAKLTQTVLRRLAPDGRDFVFSPHVEDNPSPVAHSTTLSLDSRNDLYFDYDLANIDFSLLAGDDNAPWSEMWSSTVPPQDVIKNTYLPDRTEGIRLATFYFDHSHTLYPIVDRQEVLTDLGTMLNDPSRDLASSASMFRVWMILAIGSTAHSSINLTEESASRQYYDKAMTYFEPSMDYGDVVGPHRSQLVNHVADILKGRARSYYAASVFLLLQSAWTK